MSFKSYVNIDLQGNKVTGLADGTNPTDATTKQQLDAALIGLSWKDAVNAASTGNINLAAPGASLDGYAFQSGDTFLAKDQTTDSEKGPYNWNGPSTPATRTLSGSTFVALQGAAMKVINGTVNGGLNYTNSVQLTSFTGQLWVLGPSSFSAGNGLVSTGSAVNVVTGDTSLVVNADEMHVGLNAAGGLQTASGLGVKLNGTTLTVGASGLSVTTPVDSTVARVATTAGTGTGTTFTFTHNLGKLFPIPCCQLISTHEVIGVDAAGDGTGNATVFTFASSQTLSNYQFTVVG